MNRANQGAKGRVTVIEMTVPYEMRAQCEPALLRRKPPPFQGSPWKDRARHKLFAAFVVALGFLGLCIWWFDLSLGVVLAFEFGAAATAIFLLVVLRRFWTRWYRQEASLTPINSWPMTFRIDAEGVHAENPMLRQIVTWPGIVSVTQSVAATGVWFSRMTLLVLPDQALPEGMDRKSLIQSIDQWRGAT